MAKKRRKRVYKIMKLTDECNQKIKDGIADVFLEYDTHYWDAACLADYFFMEYYPDDCEVYDEYYRQNTCLTVWHHVRKERVHIGPNKYGAYDLVDDIYIISKMDKNGSYKEVYRTKSMDTLARLFQLFNDYGSISWWTYYDTFIESFYMLWDEEY